MDSLRNSKDEINTNSDPDTTNFIPRDYKSFVEYYQYIMKRKDIKNSITPGASEPERVANNIK